jgi:hypothetical protein
MDDTPHIYPAMLRNELENSSALNLCDLAHELQALSEELPGLATAVANREWGLPRLGLAMAISFEAGRRCGVHQAIEQLHPAIEPDDKQTVIPFEYPDAPSDKTLAGTRRLM